MKATGNPSISTWRFSSGASAINGLSVYLFQPYCKPICRGVPPGSGLVHIYYISITRDAILRYAAVPILNDTRDNPLFIVRLVCWQEKNRQLSPRFYNVTSKIFYMLAVYDKFQETWLLHIIGASCRLSWLVTNSRYEPDLPWEIRWVIDNPNSWNTIPIISISLLPVRPSPNINH